MSNINNAIILCLTSFVLIIFLMNYSERFTNLINLTTLTKPILGLNLNKDFVTEDLSNLEVEEVVPDSLQSQVEELVDQILERFNKDYNKKLIRISIERVEKNMEEENKTTHFQFGYLFLIIKKNQMPKFY